jgi:hypothetical protein
MTEEEFDDWSDAIRGRASCTRGRARTGRGVPELPGAMENVDLGTARAAAPTARYARLGLVDEFVPRAVARPTAMFRTAIARWAVTAF